MDPYAKEVVPVMLPSAATKTAKKYGLNHAGAQIYLGSLGYLSGSSFDFGTMGMPQYLYADLVVVELDLRRLNNGQGALENAKSNFKIIKNNKN